MTVTGTETIDWHTIKLLGIVFVCFILIIAITIPAEHRKKKKKDKDDDDFIGPHFPMF